MNETTKTFFLQFPLRYFYVLSSIILIHKQFIWPLFILFTYFYNHICTNITTNSHTSQQWSVYSSFKLLEFILGKQIKPTQFTFFLEESKLITIERNDSLGIMTFKALHDSKQNLFIYVRYRWRYHKYVGDKHKLKAYLCLGKNVNTFGFRVMF